ncbi:hypothetical protein B0H63DRAFT_540648 [Podospora didyma]|uniref:Uncharacterized protein n=1 Tax=Podospora didyma TaxID=330526 RepID=A0AAE0NS51_9PEZI|nr:hypothetical protein B0H63DRAFT_540648 [Podospora didyma]
MLGLLLLAVVVVLLFGFGFNMRAKPKYTPAIGLVRTWLAGSGLSAAAKVEFITRSTRQASAERDTRLSTPRPRGAAQSRLSNAEMEMSTGTKAGRKKAKQNKPHAAVQGNSNLQSNANTDKYFEERYQVGIYGVPPEIPPPEEVRRGNYHYEECPLQVMPPMPRETFLHYLKHAKKKTLHHNENIFLSRLPKKLGVSILKSSTPSISHGWGIHIIERPRSFGLVLVGLLSAFICLIFFTITWVQVDLDTAIGVGQYVTGVLALIDAAIYFALQAYYTENSSQRKT